MLGGEDGKKLGGKKEIGTVFDDITFVDKQTEDFVDKETEDERSVRFLLGGQACQGSEEDGGYGGGGGGGGGGDKSRGQLKLLDL